MDIHNFIRHFVEFPRECYGIVFKYGQTAGIPLHDHFRIQGQAPQKPEAFLLGGQHAAVGFEQFDTFAAMGAVQATHIFNKSQDLHVDLAAETDGFTHIRQRYFLGGRHNQGFSPGDGLGHGQRLITRTGRGVNNQVVKVIPFNIGNKLPDDADFQRSPPDGGGILVLSHEGFNGDNLQVGKVFDGFGLLAIGPALDVPPKTQHTGNTGTMKIHIHKSYLFTFFCQGAGQIGSHAALAHAAFAAHHQDFVFDATQALLDFLILGLLLIFLVAHGATLHIVCHYKHSPLPEKPAQFLCVFVLETRFN